MRQYLARDFIHTELIFLNKCQQLYETLTKLESMIIGGHNSLSRETLPALDLLHYDFGDSLFILVKIRGLISESDHDPILFLKNSSSHLFTPTVKSPRHKISVIPCPTSIYAKNFVCKQESWVFLQIYIKICTNLLFR